MSLFGMKLVIPFLPLGHLLAMVLHKTCLSSMDEEKLALCSLSMDEAGCLGYLAARAESDSLFLVFNYLSYSTIVLFSIFSLSFVFFFFFFGSSIYSCLLHSSIVVPQQFVVQNLSEPCLFTGSSFAAICWSDSLVLFSPSYSLQTFYVCSFGNVFSIGVN